MAQDPLQKNDGTQEVDSKPKVEILPSQKDATRYLDIIKELYPSVELIRIPTVAEPKTIVAKAQMENIDITQYFIIHPNPIKIDPDRSDEYNRNLYYLTSTYPLQRTALTILMPKGNGDLNPVNAFATDRAYIPITIAVVPSNKAPVFRAVVNAVNIAYKGIQFVNVDSRAMDFKKALNEADQNIKNFYNAEK
jgi:hypothetical protein